MRSMMLAAALALTSLVAQPIAEACGRYAPDPAPTLLLLTKHSGDDGTFALLDGPVDEKRVAWRILDRRSYDETRVAPAPALATPVKLTLVGTGGSKVVSTRKQMFIREGLRAGAKPRPAVHLPRERGDFRVAVVGEQQGLAWHAVSEVATTDEARSWAQSYGLDRVVTSTFGGIELVSGLDKRGQWQTYPRHGGTVFAGNRGLPIGVLVANGTEYAVLEDEGVIRTITI